MPANCRIFYQQFISTFPLLLFRFFFSLVPCGNAWRCPVPYPISLFRGYSQRCFGYQTMVELEPGLHACKTCIQLSLWLVYFNKFLFYPNALTFYLFSNYTQHCLELILASTKALGITTNRLGGPYEVLDWTLWISLPPPIPFQVACFNSNVNFEDKTYFKGTWMLLGVVPKQIIFLNFVKP